MCGTFAILLGTPVFASSGLRQGCLHATQEDLSHGTVSKGEWAGWQATGRWQHVQPLKSFIDRETCNRGSSMQNSGRSMTVTVVIGFMIVPFVFSLLVYLLTIIGSYLLFINTCFIGCFSGCKQCATSSRDSCRFVRQLLCIRKTPLPILND